MRITCILSFNIQLKNRQVTPPYKPRIDSDRDPSNFDPQFISETLDFTPDDP
jgi:atypical protein kinase C iota type